MSVFIPVKEAGINPVEYVRPYFSTLDDGEIASLIGSVLLYRELKFNLLQSILNLSKLEVEEKLGRILQTDLWEGKFTRGSFVITKLNKQIQQQNPILSAEDKTILAYLKARYETSIGELKSVFSLNNESVVIILSKFITSGLISIEMDDNNRFVVIVYYSIPKRTADQIKIVEKQIVGYASLREQTSIKMISNDLHKPEHVVESSITELILSNSILASFSIQGSKFKKRDVRITIKHFQITFEKRSISMMNNNERIIIGVTTMQREIYIKDLVKLLQSERAEILKIISYLNGTREFEFTLRDNDVILPISAPVFQSNIAIEDIDRNSVINYRSLIGLIIAKKQVRIPEVAVKMNISEINVLKGLVDLFLNGLIIGTLESTQKFILQTIRNTKEEYVTLESWEKIIIGGLLAEGKLSMAKLGVLLNLKKELTQERALIFISRNIGKTEITNAFLTLKGKLKIPPLIQLQNLEPVDQQIFSYLVANRLVTIKKLRSLFSLSNKELYRRIYYLVGSGIIVVKTQKQTFNVISHHEFVPIDALEQLDHDLRQLIYHIENLNQQRTRIGKLASLLKWDVDDVKLDVSYLIGFGYYKGYIQGNKFIKQRGLFKFKEKPKCFECYHTLDNYLEPCPNCFARPPQCSVCRSTMNSSENIVQCPHCKNSAHEKHIMEWLKIKGFCPICRNQIRSGDLHNLSTSINS